MRRSRYDAFGIAVTNPKKIVALARLYSYGFGAVLHSEMTLYMALILDDRLGFKGARVL